jgi:hypothetical protein
MTEKKVDFALREKVAKLDGWTMVAIAGGEGGDLYGVDPRTIEGQKELARLGCIRCKVPQYEISLDAIAEACDRHNISFVLSGFVDDKDGYKYGARHTSDDIDVSGRGPTRAIAACYLFLMVMKERSLQKDRAMERDLLGRKIAEEAVALASQYPDFKQADERDRLVKALTLRRKVATLAGWTDFFIGNVNHELWGTPPLGSSNVKVPHYETSFNEISRLFTTNGLIYERETHGDNIEVLDKNILYTEKNTRLTGCGETAEIALCNLFIAVMEARLAENNFNTQTTDIPEDQIIERLNTETLFDRRILRQIREKADKHVLYQAGSSWRCAYGDLAIAADKLDAMLARRELDGLNAQTEAG